MSSAIGIDVRELYIDGFSQRQVSAVARGEMTLAEMRQEGPDNEPIDTKAIFDRLTKNPKDKK